MKAPANPFRLAMSPLSRTIFAGRIKQRDGYAEAVGVRHDVTSDFYGCLVQFGEAHGGAFDITDSAGNPHYRVTVTKLDPQVIS